jgi:hypothetical protein
VVLAGFFSLFMRTQPHPQALPRAVALPTSAPRVPHVAIQAPVAVQPRVAAQPPIAVQPEVARRPTVAMRPVAMRQQVVPRPRARSYGDDEQTVVFHRPMR